MVFDITAYSSIGPVRLGDEKKVVRNTLIELSCSLFKRNEFQENEADLFDDSIFVYYDAEGKCEAVEIPNDKHEVTFMNKSVFNMSYVACKNWLGSLDGEISEDESGITSYKYGFGIYAPGKEEDENCSIESVIVFKRGYYD